MRRRIKRVILLLTAIEVIGTSLGGCTLVQDITQASKTFFTQKTKQSATGFLEQIWETVESGVTTSEQKALSRFDADNSSIPAYDGISAYVVLHDNQPLFSKEDKERTDAFETYAELDKWGRCGVAYANICKELMPTEERGKIGSVKPSGWHSTKYNGYIEGNYLYNRCHLIGFQLAGENANEKNLITGTRYLNVIGMLPFENAVASYVRETGNHVLYRVTPVYEDDNLLASGVQIEAYSVEDKGAGICFHVYCYNVQPGITIDYANGDSYLTPNYQGEYQNAEVGVRKSEFSD